MNELLVKLGEAEYKRSQEEEKIRQSKNKIYKSLIKESYGSFNGQYEKVYHIINEFKYKVQTDDFIEDNEISKTYKVVDDDCTYLLVWCQNRLGDGNCSGIAYVNENGEDVIQLTINAEKLNYINISSTLSHEIMHKYQKNLKKIDGINEKSMNFYHHLLSFMKEATSDFSYYFFTGLYCCFSIERKANISSVSNYLEERFKNGFKTNNPIVEITKAVKDSEKYQSYEDILNYMESNTPNIFDINYITKCMTMPLKNTITNEISPFFEKEGFNVELFIKKNKEQIIKQCKYTMRKMLDNVTLFLEKKGLV